MSLLKIAALAAALTLPALPAAAQSLHDTHERVWGQSGKTAPSYRPLAAKGCKSVSPIHIAGKTPVPMHAQTRSTCDEQIAMRDVKDFRQD